MVMHDSAELAHEILNDNTPYLRQKQSIKIFFDNNIQFNNYQNCLEVRLSLIDAFYSTNMAKRLYAIQDLTQRILNITEDEEILRNKFIQYISGEEHSIQNLFDSEYGINRIGEESERKAVSLISKFAFFITNYQFPIYDSLVRENILEIIEKDAIDNQTLFANNNNHRITSRQLRTDYFGTLRFINVNLNINDYDKLDNLCWLYGKIVNASYSLILERHRYITFLNFIYNNELPNRIVDVNFNRLLMEKLENDSETLQNLFQDEQNKLVRFMKYVLID